MKSRNNACGACRIREGKGLGTCANCAEFIGPGEGEDTLPVDQEIAALVFLEHIPEKARPGMCVHGCYPGLDGTECPCARPVDPAPGEEFYPPTQPAPAPAPKALRYNTDKPRLSLFPLEFLMDCIGVLEVGAQKYTVENWRLSIGTDDHAAFVRDRLDSAFRHLAARIRGERDDEELGCTHMAAVAINCAFVFVYDRSPR